MSDPFEVPVPELATERLCLRLLSVEDAPAVHAYACDPEVARFTLWPPHESLEFTRDFLRLLAHPAFLSWAVVPRDCGELAGMVFLHSLNRHHRKAEIAFNLAKRHWRKGFATEAAAKVLDFAFHRLGLNRIEATCMPANHSSRRVLEKTGMAHEGRMRRSHFRYDGAHDMDLFAILREEREG